MSITENIQTQLDKGKYCTGVFVDLKKAFGTVNHNILLRKLDFYGMRDIANDWFSSYLKKRKQFADIENNMSSVKEILTGHIVFHRDQFLAHSSSSSILINVLYILPEQNLAYSDGS